MTETTVRPQSEEAAYWQEQIEKRTAETGGYPICGARTRQGTPCANQAGKATDHLGEGRCRRHGGLSQTAGGETETWKHGKQSKVRTEHPQLREMMEKLAVDNDVFDMREELLKIRAIMEIFAERDQLLDILKAAGDYAKIAERLHNIEVGRKHVISIENVDYISRTVQDIIFRHIPDEHTRRAIAQELTSMRFAPGGFRQLDAPVPINRNGNPRMIGDIIDGDYYPTEGEDGESTEE